jgi:hypothetical protein
MGVASSRRIDLFRENNARENADSRRISFGIEETDQKKGVKRV